MVYKIVFGYIIPVCIFFISNASRMDNCSSFADVSKMVNLEGLYTYTQVL